MQIEYIYQVFNETSAVVTDTRKIISNCLFFALKGDRFNGNDYAIEALDKGAKYAIVDDPSLKKIEGCICVENVLETLQELANFHRKELNIPIIAITGSNGKTTTKELLHAVLNEKYNCLATEGNLNNHIGVPLTLLKMDKQNDIAIVEMGANHQGEIKFLSKIAAPNYGIITNYGKAHLEGFGGVEGIIKGKSELYEYLNKSNGTAFVKENDNIQLEKTHNHKRHLLKPMIATNTVDPFIEFVFDNTEYKTHLMGSYNLENINAAFAIGCYFNIDKKQMLKAICNYIPENNRSQKIIKNNTEILLDAYNANPSSMEAAIKFYSKNKPEEKVLILGDMFELGKETILEHKKITELAQSYPFKKIVFIGKLFFKVKNENALFYEKLDDFIKDNTIQKIKGSKIMIKGSRGMTLEKITDLF